VNEQWMCGNFRNKHFIYTFFALHIFEPDYMDANTNALVYRHIMNW